MSRSEHHSNSAAIVWHEAAGVRYVTVSGEVDVSNANALDRALDAPILNVDMLGVSFFDSAALMTLIRARMGAVEFQMTANRTVRRVLDLANVAGQMNLSPEAEPDPV